MSASDHLNPVTLKELRQMVRSKLVAAGLIGFLTVELIAVALVLLSSRGELRRGIALSEQGLGEDVFHTVYFVLTVLLLFCVPFYVGVRMGAERGGEHLDLQYTTALKPRQFVDGKTAAAVVLILLFAGAALPFLSLAYLLRGLDVFQALLATAMLIAVAVGCIYEALFLAAVTSSRVFRVIILLAALVFHAILVGMVNAGGAHMVSYSPVSFATWSDCVWPALFVGACVSACILLRAVTTALIMPPPANRAPPVRFWITGLWVAWGAVAATAAWVEADIDYLYVWAMVSIIIAAILSGVSASFAPGYSRRVLGEISARAWARPRQFLFFSGAENGMVWALLLGAASVLVVAAAERIGPADWRAPALVATAPAITGPTGWHAPLTDEPGASQLAGFFLYLTAYVWSVRAVWQFGLRRWVTYRLAGVVAGVLVILGWALPALMALGNEKGGDEAAWLFGNAFAVFTLFEEDALEAVAMARAAGVWAALAVAANLLGLFAAARRFVAVRAAGGSEVGAVAATRELRGGAEERNAQRSTLNVERLMPTLRGCPGRV